MKQLERKQGSAPSLAAGITPARLAELKAIRQAQRAVNQRVEELKMKLFRMTEQHMDQAVNLIRRWMGESKK